VTAPVANASSLDDLRCDGVCVPQGIGLGRRKPFPAGLRLAVRLSVGLRSAQGFGDCGEWSCLSHSISPSKEKSSGGPALAGVPNAKAEPLAPERRP
jgi:hypothetical protein